MDFDRGAINKYADVTFGRRNTEQHRQTPHHIFIRSIDFLKVQQTSSITDSHTAGGTPVSTREAARANRLFHCLNGNLFPRIIPRLFMDHCFFYSYLKKNSANLLSLFPLFYYLSSKSQRKVHVFLVEKNKIEAWQHIF